MNDGDLVALCSCFGSADAHESWKPRIIRTGRVEGRDDNAVQHVRQILGLEDHIALEPLTRQEADRAPKRQNVTACWHAAFPAQPRLPAGACEPVASSP